MKKYLLVITEGREPDLLGVGNEAERVWMARKAAEARGGWGGLYRVSSESRVEVGGFADCANACAGLNPEAVPLMLAACKQAWHFVHSFGPKGEDSTYTIVEKALAEAIRAATGEG